MKSEVVYERVKLFVKQAFLLLNSQVTHMPYSNMECITMPAGGGLSIFMGYTPSWWDYIYGLKEEIESLPEFKACVDAIEQDSSIHPRMKSESSESLVMFLCRLAAKRRFCEPTLKGYVNRLIKSATYIFRVNAAELDEMYTEYEDALYSGKQYLAIARLAGYESDCDVLDLGSSIQIRRMRNQDLIDIWFDHYDSLSMVTRGLNFMQMQYCLCADRADESDVKREFGAVVASLRIWKAGNVGHESIYCLPRWKAHGGRFGLVETSFFGHPALTLNSNETEAFKDSHAEFCKLPLSNYTSLDLALRRFNSAFERSWMGDRLLDYVIACEALFSEAPGDLRYKIPTRMARFLEKDPREREKIRYNMRAAYDARSSIVHGSGHFTKTKVKLDETDQEVKPQDLVMLIEDYVRRSIQKIATEVSSGPVRKDNILYRIDFMM